MTPDQGTDPEVLHNKPYDRLAHPAYEAKAECLSCVMGWQRQVHHHKANIGDEVGQEDLFTSSHLPMGTVVAIYLDGMVELSTGDQVPAADLVLLRRAQ